jgi:hypothetical protein
MARNDGAFFRPGQSEAVMRQALRIAMMGQRTRITPCPDARTHVQVHVREGDEASRSLPLAPACRSCRHRGFLCLDLSGSVRCCMRRGHPGAQRKVPPPPSYSLVGAVVARPHPSLNLFYTILLLPRGRSAS